MYLSELQESPVVATNPNFVAIAVFAGLMLAIGTISLVFFFKERQHLELSKETYKEKFFSLRLMALRVSIVSYILGLLVSTLLFSTPPTMNKVEGKVVSVTQDSNRLPESEKAPREVKLKSSDQGDIDVKLNKSSSPLPISEGEKIALACAEDTTLPLVEKKNTKENQTQVRCDVIDE